MEERSTEVLVSHVLPQVPLGRVSGPFPSLSPLALPSSILFVNLPYFAKLFVYLLFSFLLLNLDGWFSQNLQHIDCAQIIP